ncbi:MAG TPA: hypothetical protein VFV67_28815 [Actinophytocola sp.]|uniref:hypothetical protein n=1 Tax=Actinophytocola sp. TaxID=1872138 RepID=UPI002DBEFDA0|nr:hypothetical protein [Actinophytocola sp.]HEU5474669.1 hypothetical protein [Actinophytocola sp.]
MAGLLVTSACSDGAPAASGPSAAPGPPAQAATLDEVEAAVTKTLATTGELVERQVMGIGAEGTFEWTSTADFDGPSGNYRVVTAFSADPPELGRMLTGGSGMALEDLTTEVSRVGDKLYLTLRAWPENLRGRWLPMTLDDAATMLAGQGVQLGDDPRSPSRLLALIDSADATVSRAGSTFRLTVPAPEAVGVLGTAAMRMFARRQIDVEQLTGEVSFEAVTDAQGRIESMRLDATDLMRQIMELAGVEVPPNGLTTTIELRLTNFGKPVSVTAPPADKLIDPAEMNR